MPTLIYIADPLCSWCYNFGPELAGLLVGLPDTPYQIIVGGLRVQNRKPLDQVQRDTLLSDWKRIEETTGLPFSHDRLSHADFVYDTELACRAVKAAEILAPTTVFDVFHSIQRAFFVDGRDMTDAAALADVAATAMSAAAVPMDAATFLLTLESSQVIDATNQDFEQTRRWGIEGFPTLVLERNGKLDLVSSGSARTEVLVEYLQALVDADDPS
jgi:putative protein-disulfide isomerase